MQPFLPILGRLIVAAVLCAFVFGMLSLLGKRDRDALPAMHKPGVFYSLGAIIAADKEEQLRLSRDSWQANYAIEVIATHSEPSGVYAIGGPDINTSAILTPCDRDVVRFRAQLAKRFTDDWKNAPADIERKYRELHQKLGIAVH